MQSLVAIKNLLISGGFITIINMQQVLVNLSFDNMCS